MEVLVFNYVDHVCYKNKIETSNDGIKPITIELILNPKKVENIAQVKQNILLLMMDIYIK
jgi:hypothetical protein